MSHFTLVTLWCTVFWGGLVKLFVFLCFEFLILCLYHIVNHVFQKSCIGAIVYQLRIWPHHCLIRNNDCQNYISSESRQQVSIQCQSNHAANIDRNPEKSPSTATFSMFTKMWYDIPHCPPEQMFFLHTKSRVVSFANWRLFQVNASWLMLSYCSLWWWALHAARWDQYILSASFALQMHPDWYVCARWPIRDAKGAKNQPALSSR